MLRGLLQNDGAADMIMVLVFYTVRMCVLDNHVMEMLLIEGGKREIKFSDLFFKFEILGFFFGFKFLLVGFN